MAEEERCLRTGWYRWVLYPVVAVFKPIVHCIGSGGRGRIRTLRPRVFDSCVEESFPYSSDGPHWS